MCALSLKWIHKDSTEESLKATVPEGYGISSKSCQYGRRGGGIALVYNKRTVTLVDSFSSEFTDAECVLFRINMNGKQLDVCVLYRYPEGSFLAFFEDLSNVIERNITSGNELLILGDFNIKSDTINTPEARSL